MEEPPRRPTKRRGAQPERREGSLDLGFADANLIVLTRAVRAQLRRTQPIFFGDLDIVPGEIAVLSVIAHNHGVTPNELASVLLLKRSAVTRLVKRLVEQGFVDQQTVESDRRYSALALTGAGKRLWSQVQRRAAAHHEAALRPLKPPEREQLLALLRKLRDELDRTKSPSVPDFDDL